MNERIRLLAKQAGIYYYRKGKLQVDTEKLTELIVRQCGYHADIFAAAGCPVDMDPTDTKPSDYIKKQIGVEL